MMTAPRHTAELALIYSIPEICAPTGRLKSLLQSAQKIAARELGNLPRLTDEDLHAILDRIYAWGKQTGWLGNDKHVSTLISFVLSMIDQSPYTYPARLIDKLNEISAYLEKGGNYKYPSCWAGSLAAERWENVFND